MGMTEFAGLSRPPWWLGMQQRKIIECIIMRARIGLKPVPTLLQWCRVHKVRYGR